MHHICIYNYALFIATGKQALKRAESHLGSSRLWSDYCLQAMELLLQLHLSLKRLRWWLVILIAGSYTGRGLSKTTQILSQLLTPS